MRDDDRFEQAWRRWATRPPRRTPAMAARAVRASLPPRRPARVAWAAALAAATAVMLALVTVLVHETTPARPAQAGTVVEAPQLGSGEVLLWLDAETPLYMTFASNGADAPGGAS